MSTNQAQNEVVILVAEDDENDASLLIAALMKAGVNAQVDVVRNGLQTIEYLQRRAVTRLSLPLLLLDLRMPQMSGFEVMEWLQQRPELRPEKIVVLSSCLASDDIQHAALLGVDHYLVKPDRINELINMMKRLDSCWSGHAAAEPNKAAA